MKEAGESSDKEKTNELPDGNAHCQRCLEVPRPYSSCVRLCKLAYIALDFDTEMKEAGESSDKEKTNELPDGNAHCQRCLEVPRPYSSSQS